MRNYNRYPFYLISSDGKLLWANPDLYLKSSGTQYIDTGYKGTYLSSYFVDFTILDGQKQDFNFIYGNRQVTAKPGSFLYFYKPYNTISAGFCGLQKSDFSVLTIGERYKADNNSYYVKINGKIVFNWGTNISKEEQSKILLFCRSDENNNAVYKIISKIYSFKIYESDVLLHNFVPVPAGLQIGSFTVPSNGMFDIVEQKFYGNSGTGDFEFGLDNAEKWDLNQEMMDYYANLLIMQYRGKQKASETIKASVSCETLDGEPLIRQNDFDIETATGAALDVLGKYIGLSREVKEKVEGGSTILNDDDYRVLLKLKIISNNGRATTSEIKTGLFNLFGNDLRLFDNRDMTYTYLFRTEYNKLLGIILAEDLLPLPMGVGADIIIEVPNVNLFGYADVYDGLDTSTITGYQDIYEKQEDWPYLDVYWILNF